MNKVYRVIWSKTKNCYVVVSEYAKRSGKCSSSMNRKLIAAFLAAGTVLSVAGSAWAATVSTAMDGSGNTIDDDTASYKYEAVWGTENEISESGYGTVWGQLNKLLPGEGADELGVPYLSSYGTAWGYKNTLIGAMYGTVWGQNNIVSGRWGTAWGNANEATGIESTAFGHTTRAGDGTLMSNKDIRDWLRPIPEEERTVTNTSGATAWGFGSQALGYRATAFGENTVAFGYNATAWGNGAVAAETNATAFGRQAQATGALSTAWGYQSKAKEYNTTAFGSNTQAVSARSVAFGSNTIAGTPPTQTYQNPEQALGNSTAFGYYTSATGTLATSWGYGTGPTSRVTASGTASTAFGRQTSAKGAYSTAFGIQSEAGANGSTAWGGFTSGSTLNKGGTASGAASTAFGLKTEAKGSFSTAFGVQTVAEGSGSSAWGGYYANDEFYEGGTASGVASTAFGVETEASGIGATAFGNKTGASGDYATAFGVESKAYGENSLAALGGTVGEEPEGDAASAGKASIAIGEGAQVVTDYTYAVGQNALATKDATDAIVFGNNASVSVADSVAIGTSASVELQDKKSVALGSYSKADKLGGYKSPGTDDVEIGSLKLSSSDFAGVGDDVVGTVSIGYVPAQRKARAATGEVMTRTLTYVGAGEISATSTDAINGSQLYAALDAMQFDIKAGDNITVTTETVNGVKTYTISSSNATAVKPGENVGVEGPKETTDADNSGAGNDTSGDAGTTTNSGTDASVDKGTYKTDNYTVKAADSKVDSVKVTKGDSTTEGNKTETEYTVTVTSKEQSVEDGEIVTKDVEKTSNFIVTDTRNKIVAGENITVTASGDDEEGPVTYTISATGGGGIAEISFNGDNKDAQIDSPKVLNIEGGATGNLTDGNIGVESDGKDTLTIRLAKDIKDVDTIEVNKSITVGGDTTINGDGMTIKDGPSVTKDGVDAGGKKITNVAPGTADTDAVNVSQLKEASGDIYNTINRIDDRMKKGLAGAAALAALHPLDFDPDDKLTFAAGIGNYRGENAGAVGAFYRPDEKVMLSVGGTFGNGENMVNAGISFSLDRVAHVTNSKTAMAREILDLRRELTELKASMASGNWMLDPSLTRLFPDTEENHWAYEYVKTLAGNHIIEGYPDGLFKGERMITRYEMAAILYRAMMSGANLPDKALNEFAAELGRFRVDRVYGKGDARHKVERIRVNDENRKERDVYGSEYDYFKKNPGANISTGALPGTKQAERAAKAEAAAKQSEKPSIVSDTKASAS